MEIGDIIYFLMVVVFGIISAFSKKKKKKPIFEHTKPKKDFFEKYFKDPEETINNSVEETPESETEIAHHTEEPKKVQEISLMEQYEELQYKKNEEEATKYEYKNFIEDSIEEFDYNDSDIGNFKEAEIKKEELIDFDLKEAIIYTEILSPKYIEN